MRMRRALDWCVCWSWQDSVVGNSRWRILGEISQLGSRWWGLRLCKWGLGGESSPGLICVGISDLISPLDFAVCLGLNLADAVVLLELLFGVLFRVWGENRRKLEAVGGAVQKLKKELCRWLISNLAEDGIYSSLWCRISGGAKASQSNYVYFDHVSWVPHGRPVRWKLPWEPGTVIVTSYRDGFESWILPLELLKH